MFNFNKKKERLLESNSKFTLFEKRAFWISVFIPPLFFTILIYVSSYIHKDYSMLNEMNVFQIYFAFSAAIFILILLISLIIYFIKDFIRSGIKGKIFLIALVVIFLLKALFEISKMANN